MGQGTCPRNSQVGRAAAELQSLARPDLPSPAVLNNTRRDHSDGQDHENWDDYDVVNISDYWDEVRDQPYR